MTFREDENRTRDRHVCENLAWLRRFALGLLKQHTNTKTSLAMKRRLVPHVSLGRPLPLYELVSASPGKEAAINVLSKDANVVAL